MVVQRDGSLVSSPPSQAMSKDILYIGSAVPLETSSGLEAVQQPLRSRYPVDDEDIQGIPSVLTVLPGGLQLKYIDDPSHVVFFPYTALNLCAAVRCVNTTNSETNEMVNRFVSLTESPNSNRPAIFTTITRRTQGRHVLECSGFLTKNPNDALDLVQWTSEADKRSKMNGGFVSMGGAASSSSFTAINSHDVSKQNTSFHTETGSPLSDTPVNIIAGNTTSTDLSKPSSYNELPKSGYFYTTENAQVKKYSLHKFSYTPGPPPQPQPPPAVHIQTAQPVIESMPAPSPKIAETVEEHHHDKSAYVINTDNFDKRSTHSVPVMTRTPRLVAVRGPPPPPPQPQMVPMVMAPPRPMLVPRPGPPPMRPMLVRGPHPGMMVQRPMMIPMAHPGMGRARPMPMMMPMPMAGYPQTATLPKQKPHRRSTSTDSSSSSTSSTSREGRNKKHHHRHHNNHIVRRDHSFDSNSRPVTPPTDYDLPTRRHSRKDEFQMRHPMINGYGGAMTMMPTRGRGGMPPGYVMLPVQSNGAIYGAPTLPRSKSVPSHMDKKSKKKKNKKKSKKDKKNNYDYHYGGADFSHESDHYGYNSDIGPPGVLYSKSSRPFGESHHRASGKSNNWFGDSRVSTRHLGETQLGGTHYEKSFSKNAAERAFSSSLAAETRKSTKGDNMFNAYAINQNGVADAEFPTMR